jgi:hypothetical protein
MMRDALFHATFRQLPPKVLGVVLLHLPVAWRRLQYLAESGRESATPLMEAVQLREAAFCAKFPEYSKWVCWNEGEAGKQQVRQQQARIGAGDWALRHHGAGCVCCLPLQTVWCVLVC